MKWLAVTVGILVTLSSFSVTAATVEVKWDDLKNFTDITAVNARQDRYQERVQKGLSEHLVELAEQLPANHKLVVTFNDVDLAGRVEPTFGPTGTDRQRILDSIAYPLLVISYRYLTDQGEVIQEGELIELKDLAPLQTRRSTMGSSRDGLYYEKRLLTDWFKDTFTR